MASHSISKDAEEHLIDRLYSQAIAQHKQTLSELDARYYPTAPPQQISHERLQQSVERQVDQEVQRRRERAGEAEAQVYHSGTHNHQRKLTSDEVDDSVRRLYTEAVQKKAMNLEESRRRYAAAATGGAANHKAATASPKLSKAQLQKSVERMSRPKKQEYTIDEINAIYGLAQPKA